MSQTTNHSTPYISVSKAAELLGVHQQTIRTMCQDGELEFFRTQNGTGHRRISIASIKRYNGEETETDNDEGFVIYARTSAASQIESLNRQVERLSKEVAKRKGISVEEALKHLVKENKSSFAKRNVMLSVVDKILSGAIKEVWVEHFNRWSRLEPEAILLQHIASKFGCSIISLDRIDTDEDEFRLMCEQFIDHATIISNRKSARKSADITRHHLSEDLLKRALELRAEGHSVRSTHKVLVREGFHCHTKDGTEKVLGLEVLRRYLDNNGNENLVKSIIQTDEKDQFETWKDECVQEGTERIFAKDLYEHFLTWNGKKTAISRQQFFIRWNQLGYSAKRMKGYKFYMLNLKD